MEAAGRAGAARVVAAAALAAAPVAVLIAVFGLRNHYRFADETISIFGGQVLIEQFPGALWDPSFSARPLERLLAWVWAAALELTPSTPAAFEAAHVVQALFAASAAIPIALLLRRLGATPRWAAAGGALGVLGPWIFYGATLLNNPLGLTTLLWGVLAGLRCAERPGWRNDALFVGAVLVAGGARAGNAPLLAGLAPAILWATWQDSGGRVGGLLREGARHWVLVLAAVAALGVLAVKGFDGLFGSYGAGRSTYLPWDALLPGLRTLGGHLAVGTGVIALPFAVGWMLRAIARPEREEERRFALAAIGVAVTFAYVYAPALNEDRYFMVLGPFVVVAFVHALGVRRLALGWLVPGALACVYLLRRGTDWPDSPDSYFAAPSSQVWNRVIEGRLSFLPIDQQWAAALLGVAAAVVAAVVLVRLRHRLVAPAILGAVLVFQALAGVYVLDKWSDGRGRPDVGFDDVAFADEAVPDGRTASLLRANPTGDVYLPVKWDDVAFFNQRLRGTLDVEQQPPCCLGGNAPLTWDATTGAVATPIATPYVITSLAPTASLAGRTIAVAPTEGFRVDEVSSPHRMAYAFAAVTPRETRLVVWPANAPGRGGRPCLTAEVGAVQRVEVGSRRARVVRRGGRDAVLLPDRGRATVRFAHQQGGTPRDIRLARC